MSVFSYMKTITFKKETLTDRKATKGYRGAMELEIHEGLFKRAINIVELRLTRSMAKRTALTNAFLSFIERMSTHK